MTHSLRETYELATRFINGQLPCSCEKKKITCSSIGGATIVGLFGELGSGKTSFTQGVACALKVKDQITSPTFVLEKIYKLARKFPFEHLIHIDCYRLDGAKEMSALGWDEIKSDPKNIIFVEWPDRVREAMPEDIMKIYFETGDKENERKIKILC